MTEPYQCSKCGETLYKSENRLSKGGYMIPMNYNDGTISRRGENHICPKDITRQKPEPAYAFMEKSHDLHEYMRRHAKLEDKDWILYVDDKRTGFVIDREKEVNV